MQDHPVLAQVCLGYSPMIDRQRAVVATRLTVFPERPDLSLDPAALQAVFAEVWAEGIESQPTGAGGLRAVHPRPLDPKAAKEAGRRPVVSLNLASEGLLGGMLGAAPAPDFMLEVPAFMAADPAHLPELQRLHAAGTVLLLKGRAKEPLAAAVQALFGHAIEDGDSEPARAGAAPEPPSAIGSVRAGVRTSAQLEAAFQRGAVAAAGWPWDDPLPRSTGRMVVPTEISVVMELIDGVERQAPVAQLEAVLRRDPTLAFRLLRYLNSPAFGLSVEISSFGHALMMLGYQRLKRWLALLLVSSAKGTNSRLVMFAALRRGLLMEALAYEHGSGNDTDTRSEMFVCGVFSLLDRLLNQPFDDLLRNVPVPERVLQALRGEGGPYLPDLELVRAIEQESMFDVRERMELVLLSQAAVNRAVLTALQSARQLDG
jgi:EAL and modified HD-GYP domain-containing signal transduction protein